MPGRIDAARAAKLASDRSRSGLSPAVGFLSLQARPSSKGFTETEQADGLSAMYRLLAQMPGVPAVIVHRFLDQGGGKKNWQTGAGVVSANGVKKPAYCALAAERGFPC